MSWLITNFVAAFLLPPFNFLLVAAIGLILWNRRPRIARALLSIAVIGLWLFSTPIISHTLLCLLEDKASAVPNHAAALHTAPQAIVILGGGTYFKAPEYTADTIGDASLVRIRYAARLHRQTRLPILITGGTPTGSTTAEAELMKAVLISEFSAPVKWIETLSGNTQDNARLSYEILKKDGISSIYLVTHAWHMPRAQRAFETAGFSVIPAATAYTTRHQTDILAFLPDANALQGSRIFMHELIGLLWYQLKSRVSIHKEQAL